MEYSTTLYVGLDVHKNMLNRGLRMIFPLASHHLVFCLRNKLRCPFCMPKSLR